jgi:alanine racemase
VSTGRESWRIRAEIDHGALRHNATAVREAVGPGTGLIAVVKADGYGHDGPEVARTLAPFVERFGVATINEACALRLAVPSRDIMLLSPCLPAEREAAVTEGFIPVVSGAAEARAYASQTQGNPVSVHLAIDTGMGRIGVWHKDAIAITTEISNHPGLRIDSISTHLPVADTDAEFTALELEEWSSLAKQLRKIVPGAKLHALNSAACLENPRYATELVRPGLALYGISPLPQFQNRLRPVMTLKSRITLVRDVGAGRGISYGRDFITPQPMRVATLAAGYADGYPRQSSNRGACVLVRGQRCPVLGRITMDQFMVDVSGLPRDVAPGEEVVLFGRQDGSEVSVGELAGWSGTIPWDILTRLGRRVEFLHREQTP